MQGIFDFLKQATEELRLEMERRQEAMILERVPNFQGPNAYQRRLMDHVAELTGFAVIQDKGTGVKAIGQLMLTSKGCFTQARFNPKLPKDCIILNLNSTDPYWYNVLFHEMAHATGVPRLLDRKGLSAEKDLLDYAFEELIAETVASTIMERFGIATDATRLQTKNYLSYYEMHYKMTEGQNGWRPIDRDKLQKEVNSAMALVLQWLSEFDPTQYEIQKQRLQDFHKFF